MMKRQDFKKDNSKSWADIAQSNNNKTLNNDWPDIKGQNKRKSETNEDSQIEPSESSSNSFNHVSALTHVMERLSTNDNEQRNDAVNLSKEEITAARKLRRKAKQIEKDEKRFLEKLAQIREPKTQKVKVIDRVVMETFLQNQQVSSSRMGTKKLKNHSAVTVNLSELINVQAVKPVDRSYIQNKQTAKLTSNTQRHKGKRCEYQKKKYVSKLKRSILMSRDLRKHGTSEVNVELRNVDLSTSHCESEKEEITDKQNTEKAPVERDNVTEVATEIAAPLPSNVNFSRKFRPYCDNYTTPELCKLTEALLLDIFRFQDRAYNKNQIKARSQKRYVVGFKETNRQLDIGKVKLLIIAPDLEQSSESGGIAETIDEMKQKCKKSEVPYVFSLKRHKLGYVLLKKVPVSCVGVLNYQGSEENSQKLLQLIQEEKVRFRSAGVSFDQLKHSTSAS